MGNKLSKKKNKAKHPEVKTKRTHKKNVEEPKKKAQTKNPRKQIETNQNIRIMNNYLRNITRSQVILGNASKNEVNFMNIWLEKIYTIHTKYEINHTYINLEKTLLYVSGNKKEDYYLNDIHIWSLNFEENIFLLQIVSSDKGGCEGFIANNQFVRAYDDCFMGVFSVGVQLYDLEAPNQHTREFNRNIIDGAKWSKYVNNTYLYFKYTQYPIIIHMGGSINLTDQRKISLENEVSDPPSCIYIGKTKTLLAYQNRLKIRKTLKQSKQEIILQSKRKCRQISEILEISPGLFIVGDKIEDIIYGFDIRTHSWYKIGNGGLDIARLNK